MDEEWEFAVADLNGLSTLAAPTSAPLKASAPATLVSSSVLRGIVKVKASSWWRTEKSNGIKKVEWLTYQFDQQKGVTGA